MLLIDFYSLALKGLIYYYRIIYYSSILYIIIFCITQYNDFTIIQWKCYLFIRGNQVIIDLLKEVIYLLLTPRRISFWKLFFDHWNPIVRKK